MKRLIGKCKHLLLEVVADVDVPAGLHHLPEGHRTAGALLRLPQPSRKNLSLLEMKDEMEAPKEARISLVAALVPPPFSRLSLVTSSSSMRLWTIPPLLRDSEQIQPFTIMWDTTTNSRQRATGDSISAGSMTLTTHVATLHSGLPPGPEKVFSRSV